MELPSHRRAVRAVCEAYGTHHIRTRPYRSLTNGKAERLIQTALRRWAYNCPNRTSGASRPCSTSSVLGSEAFPLTSGVERIFVAIILGFPAVCVVLEWRMFAKASP